MQGGVYLADQDKLPIGLWIISCLMLASGTLLLIGFLTPIADTLIGIGCIGFWLSWFPSSTATIFDTRLSLVLAMCMTVAIILLGPGAFSLDARLFGRREIIIPPASHSLKHRRF